jgi:predicted  nucleic acid-binding Zn-ribbon protein
VGVSKGLQRERRVTDDLHNEIGKLHQHIAHVSSQVSDVKKGQDDLHKEHTQLRERVDLLERNVSRDIDNLAAHEREANLYRGHLLEGFERLNDSVEKLDTRFGKHAEAEEKDRKDVIRGQQVTIRSIMFAAVTFFGTMFVTLWQTGVLS